MAVKGLKISYAPYFNKEHEHFERLHGDYSLNIDAYFLDRRDPSLLPIFSYSEEEPYDLDAFIDLLYGAYYVSRKTKSNSFDYPDYLVKHFTGLFPDGQAFYKALNDRYGIAERLIANISKSSVEKRQILTSYIDIKNQLTHLLSFFEKANFLHTEYDRAAVSFARKLFRGLDQYYNLSVLTPEEIIEYNFYHSRNSKSWIKDPFKFFASYLLSNGAEMIEYEWWEHCEFEQEDALSHEEFTNRLLQVEASVTAGLIIKYLKEHEDDQKKYLRSFCIQLNDLYSLSKKHAWSNDKLIAYSIIANKLKHQYKAKFPNLIKFPLEPHYYSRYTELSFLSRILKTPLKDRENNDCYIFQPGITAEHFRNLLQGDYTQPVEFRCNWDSGAFYYLLICLISKGIFIQIPKLEKARLYLKRESQRFKATAFRGELTKLNTSLGAIKASGLSTISLPREASYYSLIDELFR